MTDPTLAHARHYMRGQLERRAARFGVQSAREHARRMLEVSLPENAREEVWGEVCREYLRETEHMTDPTHRQAESCPCRCGHLASEHLHGDGWCTEDGPDGRICKCLEFEPAPQCPQDAARGDSTAAREEMGR